MKGATDSVSMTLGPIIGLVTHHTARVMAEFDGGLEVTCTLTTSKAEPIHLTQTVPANLPTVFAFEGLLAGSTYHVAFTWGEGISGDLAGSFHTPHDSGSTSKSFMSMFRSESLKFGVVSCNKISVTRRAEKNDVWEKLASEATSLDYIIHLGDQAYCDSDFYRVLNEKLTIPELIEKLKEERTISAFLNGIVLLEKEDPSKWPELEDQVCEDFRKVYRETWQWPSTRRALANCSNIMIFDDHEIRDDWGGRKEEFDRSSIDYFVGLCGYKVYQEYQAQLTGDINLDDPINRRDHIFLPNLETVPRNVSVCLLDVRGRVFRQESYPHDDPVEKHRSLLGTPQWRDLVEALSPDGIFKDTQLLVLGCAVPLVGLGIALTAISATKIDDALGLFTHPQNTTELKHLLRVLEKWENDVPGREIVVLGGDVHYGDIVDMTKNGKMMFRQLTASAISNVTIEGAQAGIVAATKNWNNELFDGWTFEKDQLIFRNNYGLVDITKKGYAVSNKTNQSRSFFAKFFSCMLRTKSGGEFLALPHPEEPESDDEV